VGGSMFFFLKLATLQKVDMDTKSMPDWKMCLKSRLCRKFSENTCRLNTSKVSVWKNLEMKKSQFYDL
jgi:hypothetical protein